jgi:cytochrome b subunit of formate dehydrogenase
MIIQKVLLALIGGVLLFSSSHLYAQTRADCLACHSDSTLSKEKDGKQISLFVKESVLDKSPHQKLVCVACHTGFDPNNVPHKANITPVNCMTCHSTAPMKHPFHPQLAQAIASHQEPDISCKDCHGTHDIVSPKVPGSKFNESNIVESCGECHGDVKENFLASSHGKAFAAGVKGAPNCLLCHRNNIVGTTEKPDSLATKTAQVKLCLSCHLDNPDVKARTAPTAGFIAAYEQSVHGKALLGGNAKAANCVDCHGSHEMKKGSEPTSFVNKQNIPQTCGKCHPDIAKEFNQSVHGVALAKGNIDAPTCTNCHGEHNIYQHNDPRSPVAAANLAQQVCSNCHGSLKLSEKYGIAANRSETFNDTYHGLAIRSGGLNVANCASCHGAHNIKPSSDPTSTVNKANLIATCGKCHPGANQKFAMGAVHVAMTAKEDPLLYWIAQIYIILIVGTIGGMFIHNLLDFVKKSKRKLRVRRGSLSEEHIGHGLYLRMSASERLQHGALLISFSLLVITGFMLRYPDAWWVVGIRSLSSWIFELRGIIHRIAAVIMIFASLYHLYYVLFTERGKQLFRDLLPNLKDAQDAIAVLKFNTGLSYNKPKFDRFSYIEKSEYWALVWGTAVMAGTGLIMWFDNTFIGIFTKLGYDISRTVHFYEAWLATLAIIVWHIYFVIFNPDVYPINLAFLKGTLTASEMAEEHPLELEKILREKADLEEIGDEEEKRTEEKPKGDGDQPPDQSVPNNKKEN